VCKKNHITQNPKTIPSTKFSDMEFKHKQSKGEKKKKKTQKNRAISPVVCYGHT